MNKIMIVCIAFGFALSSCNNNDNLVQFRALNESLQNFNRHIEMDNRFIYNTMGDKLKDAISHEKAMIWQPKAGPCDP